MDGLERIVGQAHVECGVVGGDAAVAGVAARVLVAPASAEEVAGVVAWCYERDLPIVPVGGRSGLAGGAAVLDGDAVAISLHRLLAIRAFDPALWRIGAVVVSEIDGAGKVLRRRRSHAVRPPDGWSPRGRGVRAMPRR